MLDINNKYLNRLLSSFIHINIHKTWNLLSIIVKNFFLLLFTVHRLYEIGPRMKLMLIKIEEGLMTGEVMYHKFIQRTPEEIKALKEKIKAKRFIYLYICVHFF